MRATRLGVYRKPSRSGFSPTAFKTSEMASSIAPLSIPVLSMLSKISSSKSLCTIFAPRNQFFENLHEEGTRGVCLRVSPANPTTTPCTAKSKGLNERPGSAGRPVKFSQKPVSANFRLNQAIRSIPAAVKHVDFVRFSIIKDEKVIVAEQSHLLNGFLLVH